MTHESYVDRQDWLQEEDGCFRDLEHTRQLASQTNRARLKKNFVAEVTLDGQDQCLQVRYPHGKLIEAIAQRLSVSTCLLSARLRTAVS